MTDLKDKAWTCINRWERRGYETQVETFKAVMAENEKLKGAIIAAIKEAKQPHYGDKYIQLDNYDDAILILEKVLEGK